MSQLSVRKVSALPSAGARQPNTIYLLAIDANTTEMWVTNNGTVPNVTIRKVSGSAVQLRTAGDAGTGAIRYAGTTRTFGQFYGGTDVPTGDRRLNYDGDFYARNFRIGSVTSGGMLSATGGFVSWLGFDVLNLYSGNSSSARIDFGQGGSGGGTRYATLNAARFFMETGGVQTATPLGSGGFTNPIWRLGSVVTSTPSVNRSIRVQIGSQIFDVPAQFIANV